MELLPDFINAGKFRNKDLPSIKKLFAANQPVSNGQISTDNYPGKVIVLVNSNTQSQGEYTAMALQSSKMVQVIGSTTAGADGNVSSISLPGGVKTRISGIGVFYPDRTPTQRIGVKIDVKVYPTLKGIIEGRDELLEKAVELLQIQ